MLSLREGTNSQPLLHGRAFHDRIVPLADILISRELLRQNSVEDVGSPAECGRHMSVKATVYMSYYDGNVAGLHRQPAMPYICERQFYNHCFRSQVIKKVPPDRALCQERLSGVNMPWIYNARPVTHGHRNTSHMVSRHQSHHTPWEDCYICNAVVVSRHIRVRCQLLVENTKQPFAFSQIALLCGKGADVRYGSRRPGSTGAHLKNCHPTLHNKPQHYHSARMVK